MTRLALLRSYIWPSLPIALGIAAILGFTAGRVIPSVPVTSDALDYQHIAEHLVNYHTYTEISDDRLLYPPVTSFFLAFLFAIQGGIVAYPLVYFVQMLCVGATAWLIYHLTRHLTKHPLLSMLAGGLILVWPYFLLYTQIVGSEILYVLLLAASVLSFVVSLDALTTRQAVFTGLCFGLAILARPVALLLPLGLLLFFGALMLLRWIPRHSALIRFSGIVLLTSLLTLAPWTAYVGYRFHRFVPVASNLGFVLEKANKTLTYLPEHIGKNEQEVSTGEMLRAKARNLIYFWDPGAGGENVTRLTERYPAAGIGLLLYKIGFFLLLALAAIGAWIGRRQPKTLVMTAVILYVWAVHTVLFPFPRYTMPIHSFVIVLAAFAVSSLLLMSAPILIFVPAKNEAATIEQVVRDLYSTFTLAGHTPHVLVIDDGSTDETRELAEQAGAHVIRHPRSQGLGRAFEEAHQFALQGGYQTLLTIDGDNQFLTSDLLRIYQTLQEQGADFVSGSRFLPESHVENMPSMRRRGNLLLAKLVTSITKRPITDSTCGLRGYSHKALAALHTFSAFTYTHEVVLNLGLKPLRFAEVPIHVQYFPERVSRIARNLFGYGHKTTFILLKSLLLYQPARLFGGLAAPFLAVGVPLVTILGIRFLLTDTVSPYKSLGIFGLVASVTGLMLITAGVLLQMLAWMQSTLEQLLYEQRLGPRK